MSDDAEAAAPVRALNDNNCQMSRRSWRYRLGYRPAKKTTRGYQLTGRRHFVDRRIVPCFVRAPMMAITMADAGRIGGTMSAASHIHVIHGHSTSLIASAKMPRRIQRMRISFSNPPPFAFCRCFRLGRRARNDPWSPESARTVGWYAIVTLISEPCSRMCNSASYCESASPT